MIQRRPHRGAGCDYRKPPVPVRLALTGLESGVGTSAGSDSHSGEARVLLSSTTNA